MRTADKPLPACVLALHRVVDNVANDHDTSTRSFQAILERLRASGRPVTASLEAEGHREGSSVVLTFDDGTHDHANAAEQLHERGLPAIFFVPSARVGALGYLTASELRHICSLGHIIGSHSHRHIPLDVLPRDELMSELAVSKLELEQCLSREVAYFAPPGGIGAVHLAAMLEENGYAASRSMRWGFSGASYSRWDVPVIPVTELTIGRGWVEEALFRGRLPAAMQGVRWVRGLIPPSARPHARRVLNRLVGPIRHDVSDA